MPTYKSDERMNPPKSIYEALLEIQGLTKNAIIVAVHMAEFKSTAEIAKIMFVGEKAIKWHKTNIYAAMKLENEREFLSWSSQFRLPTGAVNK